MRWYRRKWWRFATSSARDGIIHDVDGRWAHLIGSIWYRTDGPLLGDP